MRDAAIPGAATPSAATDGPAARLLAGGGLLASLGAFLSAACCALPLIFVILGLGGAWLAIFDEMLLYREWLLGPAALAVRAGWGWLAWQRFRPAAACAGDAACAAPTRRRFSVIALRAATFLVVGAWLMTEYQGTITASLFELRSWLDS
jgi:mercuric ion transport protein